MLPEETCMVWKRTGAISAGQGYKWQVFILDFVHSVCFASQGVDTVNPYFKNIHLENIEGMLNITLQWLEMIRTVHHPDLKYSRFLKASGTSSGLRATRTLWLSQRGQMGWAVTKQLKLLQKETDLTYPTWFRTKFESAFSYRQPTVGEQWFMAG